jgi:hypothetical protein
MKFDVELEWLKTSKPLKRFLRIRALLSPQAEAWGELEFCRRLSRLSLKHIGQALLAFRPADT